MMLLQVLWVGLGVVYFRMPFLDILKHPLANQHHCIKYLGTVHHYVPFLTSKGSLILCVSIRIKNLVYESY